MEIMGASWLQFEKLVTNILRMNNFQIEINDIRGDDGFDLFGIQGDENWAIEVKYYRTAKARPALIETAVKRVVNNGIKSSKNIQKAMLVISSFIPPEQRLILEEKFGVVIVDRSDLRIWTANSPDLSEQLNAIIDADPTYFNSVNKNTKTAFLDRSRSINKSHLTPTDLQGTELCNELKKHKRGKKGWTEYENLCSKILKYLFPIDLLGWHKQMSNEDGVNRYDFVCRVRPITEFWSFLIHHLSSRYIIFEFKNYSEKIKQGQVLTTEKYLLERGLRKVAIIFSRCGADSGAVKMIEGAMREHGKLILVINDDDVCKMLHMKENGEDPSDYLFDLTDNFLLKLPR